MKTQTIQIDQAGRVVLPKPLREKLNLMAGDKLRLSLEGDSIRLVPTSGAGELFRKGRVLVFRGDFAEPITTKKIDDLIEQEREGTVSSPTGKLRRK